MTSKVCYRLSRRRLFDRKKLHEDNRDTLLIGGVDCKFNTTDQEIKIQFKAVEGVQGERQPVCKDSQSVFTFDSDDNDLFHKCLDFDSCSIPYACNGEISEQQSSILAAAVVLREGNWVYVTAD